MAIEKSTLAPIGRRAGQANSISEWFGQRIFPEVRLSVGSKETKTGICPFLSEALITKTLCVKSENSAGVCTISSTSNGTRQDWLVCPYRVINSKMVTHACQMIFGIERHIKPKPVSVLGNNSEIYELKHEIETTGSAYVFFQDKLGGEISVLGTLRSPEISFDITIVEIVADQNEYKVNRYGILEIQTMDYHGSYKKAVTDLRDAQRLHGAKFADSLRLNPQWASNGIEGPNIANVFKRTFYQMMLKFKLAGRGAAAGTVLALPNSVWDSWQPFLGAPHVGKIDSGLYAISSAEAAKLDDRERAFICLFDLEADSSEPVSPVSIGTTIRVVPERLAEHAFQEVPNHILSNLDVADSVAERIRTRLRKFWPELQQSPKKLFTEGLGAAVITTEG